MKRSTDVDAVGPMGTAAVGQRRGEDSAGAGATPGASLGVGVPTGAGMARRASALRRATEATAGKHHSVSREATRQAPERASAVARSDAAETTAAVGGASAEAEADGGAGSSALTDADGLQQRLAERIGADVFERFFGSESKLGIEDGTLVVRVPSAFVADLLQRRFERALDALAKEASGVEGARAVFRVEPKATACRAPELVSASAKLAKAPASERFALDQFVVGRSNAVAHRAITEVLASLAGGSAKSRPQVGCVFVHGPCGVGKTHLLQGLAAAAKSIGGLSAISTSAESFGNEYVASINKKAFDSFRAKYRSADLLCFDDVHFLDGKKGFQKELLHTLQTLDLRGARLVMASDQHPSALAHLHEAVRSRYVSGAVLSIAPPDAELRAELVRRLAARRGLGVTDGAAEMLAERSVAMGGTVREIEGLVTHAALMRSVVARSTGRGPELAAEAGDAVIDEAVARLVVLGAGAGPMRSEGETAVSGNGGGMVGAGAMVASAASRIGGRRPVRFAAVLDEVCASLGVEAKELFDRGRHPRVVLARAMTTHLARQMTSMSYPEIARGMQRENHSTFVTAHKRLMAQMERGERAEGMGPGGDGMSLTRMAESIAERVRRGGAR